MLGQASAIKARNQVFEYPPLSKLAGCFLYHGTGCKDTTISSFHQLFLLLFFVLYIRHHLYSTSTTSLYSTSSTSLYSTSSTSLIPLPPPPSLHSPKIDVVDIGKSTSTTSVNRRRRRRFRGCGTKGKEDVPLPQLHLRRYQNRHDDNSAIKVKQRSIRKGLTFLFFPSSITAPTESPPSHPPHSRLCAQGQF